MLKVFLCHSSNDKPAVRELYQRLKAEPWIDPWLDEEEIFPGQDWDLEIEKAVEETDAVLVVLSSNSVSKEGYVQRELRMILRMAEMKPEGAIFTIPLRLEDCKVPRRVSMWQYVDFYPENRKDWAYKRLLGALKIRAKKLNIKVLADKKTESKREEKEEKEEKRKKATAPSEAEIQARIEERARQLALEMAQKAREEKAKKEKAAREEKERREREARAANPAGIEWIKIPAGEFIMGSNDGDDDEKPERKVYLPDYLIAKSPITNAQFKKFIEAGGYKDKAFWSAQGWQWRKSQKRSQPGYWTDSKWNTPTQPVVGVSWYEAEAFANWANCRLPSEAEWEKAARGTDGRKYPWGDQKPNKNLANFKSHIGKTTPVGKYSPAGDSPYGCVDMAGNVWEWSADWYDVYSGGDPSASSEFGEKYKVLRGGSWYVSENDLRSANRGRSNPTLTDGGGGFRCSRSPLS